MTTVDAESAFRAASAAAWALPSAASYSLIACSRVLDCFAFLGCFAFLDDCFVELEVVPGVNFVFEVADAIDSLLGDAILTGSSSLSLPASIRSASDTLM
jgi:hypothetical protein